MKFLNHFKQQHTWIDFFGMILLWCTYYLLIFLSVPNFLLTIVKIFAIVAFLEFLSFTLYHFLNSKKSLVLQSFLGGFISSTTTFIRIISKDKLTEQSPHLVYVCLIAAFISMLIECVIIYFSFIGTQNIELLVPVLIQLAFFILVFLKNLNFDSSSEHVDLKSDHPILWKKVLSLASFIILLIFLLRFIGNYFSDFNLLAALILSFFEAHGVFAASISRLNETSPNQIGLEIMLILTGNFISKSFLILKAKKLKIKKRIVTVFSFSIFISWIAYFLMR